MFQAIDDKNGHHGAKTRTMGDNSEGGDMGDTRGIIARIEELRIERGWSQAQLSERAGLGKGAVNDLANHPERKPRPATLAAIAAALGVDVAHLEGAIVTGAALGAADAEAAIMGAGGVAALRGGAILAYDIPPVGLCQASRDIALVDPAGDQRSGDALLVETDIGLQVGHLAEPYVVTTGAAGELRHLLRGAADCQVVGRVVSRMSIF